MTGGVTIDSLVGGGGGGCFKFEICAGSLQVSLPTSSVASACGLSGAANLQPVQVPCKVSPTSSVASAGGGLP